MGGQIALKDDHVEILRCHALPPGHAVTNRTTASPLRTNQTLVTRAAPPGPLRIARIVNDWPNGSTGPDVADSGRCYERSAVSNSRQLWAVKPRLAKNRALNRPTGCTSESR
jgi:hypothetical protein